MLRVKDARAAKMSGYNQKSQGISGFKDFNDGELKKKFSESKMNVAFSANRHGFEVYTSNKSDKKKADKIIDNWLSELTQNN